MFPANYQEWQNQSYQQGSPSVEAEGDLNGEELSSGMFPFEPHYNIICHFLLNEYFTPFLLFVLSLFSEPFKILL